jgi:molecular chaperone GrpE
MDDETKPNQDEKELNAPDIENASSTELVKELSSFKKLIRDHLDKQIEQNRFKDETINRLQKTVSEYEKGLVSKIKEPLIWSIIFFKDSFEKFKEKFEEASMVIVSEIEMLNEELDEVLYSHGIEKINSESDFYDREKQIVRKKEITENPEEDRLVVKVLKHGYLLDGKLLRKEEILVKVFEQVNQPSE